MTDDVLLACHKCGKQRNIELDQARQYNKENPYNCFDCQSIPEPPKEEEQSRLGLIETNTDLGQSSSPLGNLLEGPQRIESYRIEQPIYHDPDVNAEIQRTGAIYQQPPRIEFQAQTDFARQKIEEFRLKRQQIERELARETERIDHYDHGGGGFNWHLLIVPLIMLPIMILVITSINSTVSSTVSSIDCSKLQGNAGPNQTIANAKGTALECLQGKKSITDSSWIIFAILPFVLIIIIIPLLMTARGI